MDRPDLHQYPFIPKSITVTGNQGKGTHTISCLDEGKGPCVVMVHGNPSWSYLYRNLVSGLKDRYRCVVPDHLGCGLSDKPQDYPYQLQNHIDNLSQVLDQLEVEQCVLVVHDWGGAIGMGWAGLHPDRIAGMVVLNTAAFLSQRIPFRIAICRWPIIGGLLVRGLNGFAWPATFMAVHNRMNKKTAAGFLHPYNSWANRVAVHRFVQDIPLQPDHPSYDTLSRVEAGLDKLKDKKTLLCWGGEDFCFNDHFYKEWQHRFPEAESHYFQDAGHYLLEDAADKIMTRVNPFLSSCYG